MVKNNKVNITYKDNCLKLFKNDSDFSILEKFLLQKKESKIEAKDLIVLANELSDFNYSLIVGNLRRVPENEPIILELETAE